MADYLLYDYWRSSAAYRVRLALALKGLTAAQVSIDLRQGEQSAPPYHDRNPQGLVPSLVSGALVLTQSLAIMEYLDELHPEPPLLPADAAGRAQVRAAAQLIACDIHPLNNLRVLNYLGAELGCDTQQRETWVRHWVAAGLTALESFAERHAGQYLWKDQVTLADLCLLPQLYNARRFAVDLGRFPQLARIEGGLAGLPWCRSAGPDAHRDRNG